MKNGIFDGCVWFGIISSRTCLDATLVNNFMELKLIINTYTHGPKIETWLSVVSGMSKMVTDSNKSNLPKYTLGNIVDVTNDQSFLNCELPCIMDAYWLNVSSTEYIIVV